MREFRQWVALFIASGLTVGFWPTWVVKLFGKQGGAGGGFMGSLLGFGIQCWFMERNYGAWVVTVAVLVSFFLGWFVAGPAERLYTKVFGPHARHTGEVVTHDYNWDCMDEVHGQLLAGLPAMWYYVVTGESVKSWVCLILSFFLFRGFDGKKWWPVNRAEKWRHGTSFSIMFDDTVAGLMAAIITFLVLTFPGWLPPNIN